MAGIDKKFGNYFKNVAKSTAYLTRDILDAEIPEIGMIANTSVKTAASIVDTVKNFDKITDRITDSIKNSKVGRDIDNIVKNTAKDLKSGKFYNSERMESEDPFGQSGRSSNAEYNAFRRSAQVNMKISQVEMMNEDKNNNINRSMWTKHHAENMTMSIAINKNLANMVDTMNDKLLPFLEDATNYMNSSLSMQEQTIGVLQEVQESLALQINGPEKNNEYSTKNGIGDMFNSDGTLKYEDVLNIVKGNIKKNYIDPIIDSFTDFEGNSILTEIAKNPIGFLLQNSIQNAIPYELRDSIYNFRQTLGGVTAGMFERLKEKGHETKLSSLFNTLFENTGKVKDKVRLDKYERGPIPFDGVTKKAVTHVIPTLLAKIYSAIIGQEDELIYSYDRGAFAWGKDYEASFEKAKQEISDTVFFEMKEKINDALDIRVKQSPDKLSAPDANYFKEEFSRIIDYLKVQKEPFNYKDISQKSKLVDEFGSAALSFYELYEQIFTNAEKAQHNARRLEARRLEDMFMNTAQNESQETGYAQYYGSKMADKKNSGIEFELTDSAKRTRDSYKINKLYKIKQDYGYALPQNVKGEIDNVIRDIENGKNVKIEDFYFTKSDYLNAVTRDAHIRKNGSSTRKQREESAKEVQSLVSMYKEQQLQNKNDAENTVIKRDNMFLRSINNIYEKLKEGIIVFPSANVDAVTSRTAISNTEQNEQRIAERKANTIIDSYKRGDDSSSPATNNENKKIDAGAKTPPRLPKLDFNVGKVSDRDAVNLMKDNQLTTMRPDGYTSMEILKQAFPSSSAAKVIELIQNNKKTNGKLDLSHLKEDVYVKTLANMFNIDDDTLGSAISLIENKAQEFESFNDAADLVDKIFSQWDEEDNITHEKFNKVRTMMSMTLGSYFPLLDDISVDMLGENNIFRGILGLTNGALSNYKMTDSQLKSNLNYYRLPKGTYSRDKVRMNDVGQIMALVNTGLGMIGREISIEENENATDTNVEIETTDENGNGKKKIKIKESQLTDLLQLINMYLSNDSYDRLIKFARQKGLTGIMRDVTGNAILNTDGTERTWIDGLYENKDTFKLALKGLNFIGGGQQIEGMLTEMIDDVLEDTETVKINPFIKHFLQNDYDKQGLRFLSGTLGKSIGSLMNEGILPDFLLNKDENGNILGTKLSEDTILDEKTLVEQFFRSSSNFNEKEMNIRFKDYERYKLPEKGEIPKLNPIIEYYLKDILSEEALYFASYLVGKEKSQVAHLIPSDRLKDIPQNRKITEFDVIKIFGEKYSTDFNAENFEKELNEYKNYLYNNKLEYKEGEQRQAIDVSNETNAVIRENRNAKKWDLITFKDIRNDLEREGYNQYYARERIGNKFGDLVEDAKYNLNPFSIVTEIIGETLESTTGSITEGFNTLTNMLNIAFYGKHPDDEIKNRYLLDDQEEQFNINVENGLGGGEVPRSLKDMFNDLKERITSGELLLDIEDRIMTALDPAIDFVTRRDDKGLRGGIKSVAKSSLGFLGLAGKDAMKTAKNQKRYVQRDGLNYTGKYAPKTNFSFDRLKDDTADTIARYAPHAGMGLKGAGIAGLAGILLPGPALAYATIGGLASMAKQTGDLDRFLFGKDGSKKGKGKKGGILPESWTKALKGKKMFGQDSAKMIAGGAAIGGMTAFGLASANAMGLIPHFFMPGGVIGAALLGAGYQLVKNSEGLSSLLFGEKNGFGKRDGSGIIPKKLVEAWPNMKKWGTLGLIAGYFLPGGPVLGTILGTIGGALGGTDTFKRILWGDYDPVTKFGSKGILGETMDILQRRILNPFLVNMQKTFSITKSIKDNYYGSINNEFKNMFTSVAMLIRVSVQDALTSAGNKLKKTKFGSSIARMVENVIKPFTWGFSKITGAFGSLFNKVFKAPADIMSGITKWSTRKLREKAETSTHMSGKDIEKLKEIENSQATADVLHEGNVNRAKSRFKTEKKMMNVDNAEAYARSNASKFVTDLYEQRFKDEDSIINKGGSIDINSLKGLRKTEFNHSDRLNPNLSPKQIDKAIAAANKNKMLEEQAIQNAEEVNSLRKQISDLEAKTKIDYFDPKDPRYKGLDYETASKLAKKDVMANGKAYDDYLKRANMSKEQIAILKSQLEDKEMSIRAYLKPTLDREHEDRLQATQRKTRKMIKNDSRINYLKGKLKKTTNPEIREQLLKEINERERIIKLSRGYDMIEGDTAGSVKTVLDPNYGKSNNEILQDVIKQDKEGNKGSTVDTVKDAVANTIDEFTEQLEDRSNKKIITEAFASAVDSIKTAFPGSKKKEEMENIETNQTEDVIIGSAQATAESIAAVTQAGTKVISDGLQDVVDTVISKVDQVISTIKGEDSGENNETGAKPSNENNTGGEKVEDTVTRKSDEEVKKDLNEKLNEKWSKSYNEEEAISAPKVTAKENITPEDVQEMNNIVKGLSVVSQDYGFGSRLDGTYTVAEKERDRNYGMEFRNAGGTIIDKNDGMSMQEQQAVEEQKAISGSLLSIAESTKKINENTDELEGLFGMGTGKEENPILEWIKNLFTGGEDGTGLIDGVKNGISGIIGGTIAPIISSIVGGVTGVGKQLLSGAWNIVKSPSKWLPALAIGTVGYNLYKGITAETPDESYEYFAESMDISLSSGMTRNTSKTLAMHADDLARVLVNCFADVQKALPKSAAVYVDKLFDWIVDHTDDIFAKCKGLATKVAGFLNGVAYAQFGYDLVNGYFNAESYYKTYDYEASPLESLIMSVVHTLNNFFLFGLLDESWLCKTLLSFFGYDLTELNEAQAKYEQYKESTGMGDNKFNRLVNPTFVEQGINLVTGWDEKTALVGYNGAMMLATYYRANNMIEEAEKAEQAMNSWLQIIKDNDIDISKASDYINDAKEDLVANNKMTETQAENYATILYQDYGILGPGADANKYKVIDEVTRKAVITKENSEVDEFTGELPEKSLMEAVNNGNYNPDTKPAGYNGLSNFYNSVLSVEGVPVVKPEWLSAYEQYCAAYGVMPSEIEDRGIDERFAEDWVNEKINYDNLMDIIKLGDYKINGKKTKKLVSKSDFDSASKLIESNLETIESIRSANDSMKQYSTQSYVDSVGNGENSDSFNRDKEALEQVKQNQQAPAPTKAEELGLEEEGWNEKFLESFEKGEWDYDHSSIGEFAALLRSKGYEMPEWWEAWKIYTAHYGITEDEDITKAPKTFAKDYLAGKIDPYNMQDYYNKYQINGMWDAEMLNRADGKTDIISKFGNLFNYSTTTHTDLYTKHEDKQDAAVLAFSNRFGTDTEFTKPDETTVEEDAVTNTSQVLTSPTGRTFVYDPATGKYYDENNMVITEEELIANGVTPIQSATTTPEVIDHTINLDGEYAGLDIGGFIDELTISSQDYTGTVTQVTTDVINANKDFYNTYTENMGEYYDEVLRQQLEGYNNPDNAPTSKPTAYTPPTNDENIDNEMGATLSVVSDTLTDIQPLLSNNSAYGGFFEDKKVEKETVAKAATKKEPKIDYKELASTFGSSMAEAYTKSHAQDNIKAGIGGQLDLEGNKYTYGYNGRPDAPSNNKTKTGTWELPLDTTTHKRGEMTSTYGWRSWDGIFHNGIDIDTGTGDPVYSIWPGKVRYARKGWNDGYGSTIWIDHDNGLSTLYGHQHEIHVEEGERVKAGQQVGESGGKPSIDGSANAGHSSGDHLHFTIYKPGATYWDSKEGGMHVNPEFIWNPNAPVPAEISDIVKATSYNADGSGSSSPSTSNITHENTTTSTYDGVNTSGSSFADIISQITGILQSSVMGEVWGTDTSTSVDTNANYDTSNMPEVSYNGKLDDVDLVDFANLGSNKEQFLERIQKGAISNYLDGGVIPSLTMAQAILESGWGKSALATKGNALFGITAGSSWKGPTWDKATKTVVGYHPNNKGNFRTYNNWDESIADHGELMKYQIYKHVANIKNLREAAIAVKKAGYTPDAGYEDQLYQLGIDNNLFAVDKAVGIMDSAGGHIGGAVDSTAKKPSIASYALGIGKAIAKKVVGNFYNEVKNKNQELKQFRQNKQGRGGYLGSDMPDQGGIWNNIVNTATNVYNKVKDVYNNVKDGITNTFNKNNKTSTVTTTTSNNQPSTGNSITDTKNTSYTSPTTVIEKVITEVQPSKFNENGVLNGASTITAMGTETSSPVKVLEDSFNKHKSKLNDVRSDRGGSVEEQPAFKPTHAIKPKGNIKQLNTKLKQTQLKAGTQKGEIGGSVEDIFNKAKQVAEQNKQDAVRRNADVVNELNKNEEKRINEIKQQQLLNRNSTNELLKESIEKVKSTVSTYQKDISNSISTTLNADTAMKANMMDNSNWDSLLSLMQEICDNTNEIASNTSSIDSNTANMSANMTSSQNNVNITNNISDNKSDNKGMNNSDVASYVKNIFMGNEANDMRQNTTNILRNQIGIMARGD